MATRKRFRCHCTVCDRECEKRYVSCVDCGRWTHIDCVHFCDSVDDVRKITYICRDCVNSGQEFDWEKSLIRLKTSRNKRKAAEDEIVLIKTYFSEPTAQLYAFNYASCSQEDSASVAQLRQIDPTILLRYSPRSVIGDGNCFYRSVSLALYGTQNYHGYLRVRTAVELICNKEAYTYDSPTFVLRDLPIMTPAYHHLLRSTVSAGSDSEMVHLFALSKALAMSVQSYCPLAGSSGSLHPYTLFINQSSFTRLFTPGTVTVMWSSEEVGEEPNHIVLLVPKHQPTGLYDTPSNANRPTVAGSAYSTGNYDTDVGPRRSDRVPSMSITRKRHKRMKLDVNEDTDVQLENNSGSDYTSDGSGDTVVHPPLAESTRLSFQACHSPATSSAEVEHQNVTYTIPQPLEESSIDDDTPEDHTVGDGTKTPITYQVVGSGTQRDKAKLMDSLGYGYNVKRQNKHSTIWQCTVRNKTLQCPVTIKQTGSAFIQSSRHAHAVDPGTSLGVKIIAEVKRRAVYDIFKPAGAIVDEVLLNHVGNSEPCSALPKPVNIARAANRRRQNMRPTDPTDLDFEFDNDFLPDGFKKADLRVRSSRHLIFATDAQLAVLSKAKTWYMDGTFSVVKQPFHQLLSIHAFVKADDCMKQVPLAFILMASRKTGDYKACLRSIVALLPTNQPRVQEVIVDFERAAWKAVSAVLPNVHIRGCAFHWTQAVWRKAQSLGLQQLYLTDDATQTFIRRLLALPFLPAEHISHIFARLIRKASTPALITLTDYISQTWITSRLMPPSSWSVFNRPVRTNNDVEGWHRRLNGRAQKGQVPFYLLLQLLHDESRLVTVQLRLVRSSKLQRHQKKKFRLMQGRIQELWQSFREGRQSASQLLKACSRVYAPHVE